METRGIPSTQQSVGDYHLRLDPSPDRGERPAYGRGWGSVSHTKFPANPSLGHDPARISKAQASHSEDRSLPAGRSIHHVRVRGEFTPGHHAASHHDDAHQ